MTTYLITGANRGIGLEYCRQLNARGANVIAACRNSSKEIEKLPIRIETGVNLEEEKSLQKLKANLEDVNIDVLINNAGFLENETINSLDLNTIKKQFQINCLAPLYLTKILLGNLSEGSKVIFMTSRMGSISDNISGGFYGYRISKASLCMAGKSLSVDLKPLGISVGLLHPGLVSTKMTNYTSQGISPKESVEGLIKRIDELSLDSSGSFWHANGEILPW
tara:strand:- start:484 stop:1149 length:666 start_codon:yes stop_codon:yes gene_type:complete